MRWVSNRESVRKGEPSVLAIAETLIAMALSLWIAVHFGTVKHVVIGACVAPFLLLRTDECAVLGFRVFGRVSDRLHQLPERAAVLHMLLLYLSFLPIQAFATIAMIVRSPFAVLRAIPGNWRRITVATDFCRSPEWLPVPDDPELIKQTGMKADVPDLYRMVRWSVTDPVDKDWRVDLETWVYKWFFGIPVLGLPPILYRLSLKSTAIIWFRRLWALRPVGPSDEPLRVRLRLFERSDIFRFVLLASAAVLLLFASKLIFWNELSQASNLWNESIGGRILTIHVAPGVVEWWQLATALNSVIAIGLWLYVRSCLRHVEAGVPRRETVVESLLAWGLFVRRLLTTYTVLCVGYMYLREAATWQLPPLGGKPFPWM